MSDPLEIQIDLWRAHLEAHPGVAAADVDELEDHLRGHIEALSAAGLSDDEAFLVAVKRLGSQRDIAREFARENSRRLWKQLVLGEEGSRSSGVPGGRASVWVALAFAAAGGLLMRLPLWLSPEGVDTTYALFLGPLLLTAVVGYLLWRHRPGAGVTATALAGMAAAAALAGVYAPAASDDALVTTALHVPVLAWLLAMLAYAGTRWRETDGRMDAVRFTGEWVIYMVLLGLGGGVLMGIVALACQAAGLDASTFVFEWMLPLGAGGAAVVAAWLVEAKQSVIENMAPVLARVFTPLFAVAFAILLVVVLASGDIAGLSRDLLLVCNVILIIAIGLVLYNLTARESDGGPTWFDRVQLALVAGALALDAVALVNVVIRIGDGGWTLNRVVILGLNLLLLVNLAVTASLLVRLNRAAPGAAHRLERWQTGMLPAYGAWALVVVAVLPAVFAS
ncbi:permease prefix domain 1-containing protein [Demequina sp. NBRC 110051]|uniref:permease prefix domain 1-containing protein n=1 Tax=Demequina sp. NBRC 110051 TaxID=1570340 RepID=UPI0009FF25E7|nr:permease prefix domain 1-containing protein [Demequina sp. NBRC 110051]